MDPDGKPNGKNHLLFQLKNYVDETRERDKDNQRKQHSATDKRQTQIERKKKKQQLLCKHSVINYLEGPLASLA